MSPHVYPVSAEPVQPPGAAATAAHTSGQPGQGVALADAVTEVLAVEVGVTDAVSDGVDDGLHASQQAPGLVALPEQPHEAGRQSPKLHGLLSQAVATDTHRARGGAAARRKPSGAASARPQVAAQE